MSTTSIPSLNPIINDHYKVTPGVAIPLSDLLSFNLPSGTLGYYIFLEPYADGTSGYTLSGYTIDPRYDGFAGKNVSQADLHVEGGELNTYGGYDSSNFSGVSITFEVGYLLSFSFYYSPLYATGNPNSPYAVAAFDSAAWNYVPTTLTLSPAASSTSIDLSQSDFGVINSPTSTGIVQFTDSDTTTSPFAALATPTISATDPNGDPVTLTAAQQAVIAGDFSLSLAAGNSNNGSINWTYNPSGTGLAFIDPGETIQLTQPINVSDQDGQTQTSTVSLTLNSPISQSDADVITLSSQLLAQIRADPANSGLSELQIADLANLATTGARSDPPFYGSNDQYAFLQNVDPQTLANMDHFLFGYEAALDNGPIKGPVNAFLIGTVLDFGYNLLKEIAQAGNLQFLQAGAGALSPANFDFWALSGALQGIQVRGGGPPPGTVITPIMTNPAPDGSGIDSIFVDDMATPEGITPLDPKGANSYFYNNLTGQGIHSILLQSPEDLDSTFSLGFLGDQVSLGYGQTYIFPAGVTEFTISGLGLTSDEEGPVSDIAFNQDPGDTDVFLLEADGVACYASGTALMTSCGETAVETLRPGDYVMTLSGRTRSLLWLGRRSYAGRFLAANPHVQPIRFQAGSLGDDLPRRDLLVSPEHAMYLDCLLIPARCLVNGSTITQERGLERVDYYHVELDTHDVILAEGAASESFMDDDSRGMFHNASEYAALYPDAPRSAGFCAPRVTDGYQLEAIRQRLADVAVQLARAA